MRATADQFGDLGPGLVGVCLAAVEGQQTQWDVVARALAGSRASGNACLDEKVRTLLGQAFAWHQRHPGRSPTVRFHTVAGKTDCGKKEQDLADTPPEPETPAPAPAPTSQTAPPEEPKTRAAASG